MRRLTWMLLFGCVLMPLQACAGGAPQEPAPSSEAPDGVSKENEELEDDGDVFPLTGEPAEGQADHRVVSVMINNHTKARPQSGLSQADIVFEVLAEAQITRFLALFHSQLPDTIGPVRSARPYYNELAAGFNALYVYHGASTAINRYVAESGIPYLDGAGYDNNGWLFERSSERKAPHNSYLRTQGIERFMKEKGYEKPESIEALPFEKENGETSEGSFVEEVRIIYSERPEETVTYTVRGADGRFERSSDGEPSVDQLNGERLTVDNVWIVETKHAIIDSQGRRAIDLTSGGNGYLLQNGKIIEAEWKNVNGRLLPYRDGRPIRFTPGKTWVNIIPEQARIETTYRK
ncbi:DUF3048 domain-containing protein [Halobacillus sp. K22]|uniref:DUF3048 domain-containing protein n=1 Tax=Halobacillus sp. K22 TaxID=3457431 RepID=UPI003FCE4D20